MTLARRAAWLLLLLHAAPWAADEPEAVPASAPAASAPASAASASAPVPSSPYDWKWEGAIGPVGNLSPQYAGSASRKISVVPGYYLRYGRISISNTGGFVTRRNKDDILQGLSLDMKRNDRLRLGLSLRIDNGRKSNISSALAGIEDVRRTIRMRASGTVQLDHGNKLSSGWNMDLLGRGGGNVLDFGASHDRRISPATTWSVGGGFTWADRRYMRSYYGVTPAESTASGYAAYEPGSGLRDVSVGTNWRMEINQRWIGLWGGSVGRLLGPAARSPLTTSPRQWGLSAGIAWLF